MLTASLVPWLWACSATDGTLGADLGPSASSGTVLVPSATTLAPGATQQYKVLIRTPDGVFPAKATFSSSGGTITPTGLYTAGDTAGTFKVIAVQEEGTEADTSIVTVAMSGPPMANVAVLQLTPAQYTFTAVGQTVQFSATAHDTLGAPMTGLGYAWASTDTLVAVVDSLGKVTARAAGGASIMVSAVCCSPGPGQPPASTVADTAAVLVQIAPAPIPPEPGINWLWETGLETDQPFNASFTHAGGSVVRSTESAHSGSYSLKFTTPAERYRRASVVKALPWAADIKKVDIWFYYPIGQASATIEVAPEGWTGTTWHAASIQYANDPEFPALIGWQLWAEGPGDGKWEFLPGGAGVAAPSPGMWHHIEMIVDYGKQEYVSFKIDDAAFDLTGRPYVTRPRVTETVWNVNLLLWTPSPGNNAVSMFLDDARVGRVMN